MSRLLVFVSMAFVLLAGWAVPLAAQAAAGRPWENGASVADLKKQIVALAESDKGLADTDGSKKSALEALIAPLLALTPPQTTAAKAQNAIGAWHQIWGPYHGNDPTKVMPGLDPDSIYQVLSPDGTFANVAVIKFGFSEMSVLKGVYQVQADQIAIAFTQLRFVNPFASLPLGFGLQDLPALVAANQIGSISAPPGPPIGIKGSLHEIYSDADLRLTYGEQNGQSGQSLFVEQRVAMHGRPN